jgi:hypothetical protein
MSSHEQWNPTDGDNVRIINPARASYGKDGVVVHTTSRDKYVVVTVRFEYGGLDLYEPDELELLR